jgi:hypothetical protein
MKLDEVWLVFKIVLVKFKFHCNNDLTEAQCDCVCQQETALRLGHKAKVMLLCKYSRCSVIAAEQQHCCT